MYLSHMSLNDNNFGFELIKRIQSKTVVNDNLCFLFEGAQDKDGYGMIRFHNRNYPIHRLIGYIFKLIPSNECDLSVLHKCNIRNCWNPYHLYGGTPKENGKDQRNSTTHCKNGHDLSIYGRISKGELSRVGTSVRRCSLCRRLQSRASYNRKREEVKKVGDTYEVK